MLKFVGFGINETLHILLASALEMQSIAPSVSVHWEDGVLSGTDFSADWLTVQITRKTGSWSRENQDH